MKLNKKAFTLVELVAILIILVIIVLIAYSVINGILERSRLRTFRIDESMLVNSAQFYLTQNNQFLPEEDGDIVKIYYTDMRDNGAIKIVRDPKNNQECFDISHVIVEKISENDYEYTAALACPNYISLNSFNLLKYYVDFTSDEDENGLADGVLFYSSQNVFVPAIEDGVASYEEGVQIVEYVRADKKVTLGIEKVNPPTSGDIIYVTSSYKATREINLGEALYVEFGESNFNVIANTEYQMYSDNIDVTNESHKVFILNSTAEAGDKVYIKNVVLINLTEIWGAGEEPSKSEMDQMVINMMQ